MMSWGKFVLSRIPSNMILVEGLRKKMIDSFPPNCYSWLLKQPTEMVLYPQLEVGDIIIYDFTVEYPPGAAPSSLIYLITSKNDLNYAGFDFIGPGDRKGLSGWDLGIKHQWPRITANWGEFNKIDPNRKDYCHKCQTDQLVWVMMAARCRECNAIILGG